MRQNKTGEGAVSEPLAAAICAGLFVAIVLGVAIPQAPAHAQSPVQASWLDPALHEAAKKEGSVVVYTSTNEREGLPLFKIFEDATGIKVHYIRAERSVWERALAELS